MACPLIRHDYHVEQLLQIASEGSNADKYAAHPQVSDQAFEKAQQLIHELYGDAFRELAKV